MPRPILPDQWSISFPPVLNAGTDLCSRRRRPPWTSHCWSCPRPPAHCGQISLFCVLCLCFLSKQIVNKFYFLLVFLAGGSVHIVHDLPGHIHNNPPGSLAPSKVGSANNNQNNDQWILSSQAHRQKTRLRQNPLRNQKLWTSIQPEYSNMNYLQRILGIFFSLRF